MFTNSEKRVIFFIIGVLLIGSVIKLFYPEPERNQPSISPFPIDLNMASKEELTLLPGIGETYAERIINFRKLNKGFKTKEDILKVKGIGPKTFEKIKDKVYTGGKNDDKRR
ncbi:MAG: helix-hairpin-helix domain-containing protein [candidate division WOR-3 bacterium]|nr:helix-hairpin-helix domain-containing protein [candidate division WOR-3 bacterium]